MLRELELLVAAGWEPNLVLEMDENIRAALCIIHVERTSLRGDKFNFTSMAWERPQKKQK